MSIDRASGPERRRAVLALGGAALIAPPMAPRTARASWPERPLRLVVPFAPGGNADLVARTVAPAMSERLGQTVLVENRPGAAGSVAATQIARTRWDGATLLVGSNGPLAINPVMQPNPGYDPIRDFQPIGLILRTPLVLAVHRGQAARDLAALITASRAAPGRIIFGTAGIASTGHLTLEVFNAATGAGIAHAPYTGGGALTADLVSGTLGGACVEISTVLPLHRDGAARALAITAMRRTPAAPEVPTTAEAGVADVIAASFIGLLAPAGAPSPALSLLHAALAAAVAAPAIRQRLEQSGSVMAEAEETSPAGFAAFLERETEWTRAAAARAGLKPG